MENKDWEQYRDAATFLHAVETLGKDRFAVIVASMLKSGIPVTAESFDEEVHGHMDIAVENQDNSQYYKSMLAHAFFDKFIKT